METMEIMGVAQRNELAKNFILRKLETASKFQESDFRTLNNYQQLSDSLNDLICVPAMGFRGVVATAITGKFLNPDFDPLNNFYSCNPRSIFEQGIFYAFENRVPCGKSDPLNVAKNTNVLDYEWARGKRPHSAAKAVVDTLRFIENSTDREQEDIINFFFFRLLKYANSIANTEIRLPEGSELSTQVFGSKLIRFILEYPESGTTPQLIISMLLNKLHAHSHIVVKGGNESVFGTNTTSKKPADIWLEVENNPIVLYEITVKKIDAKRLDDCIQSLHALNMLDRTVFFICRIPTDINTLDGLMNGTLNYKGKIFNFQDISSFIYHSSSLLSSIQLNDIIQEIKEFVERIDRPMKTKEGWNNIFGS